MTCMIFGAFGMPDKKVGKDRIRTRWDMIRAFRINYNTVMRLELFGLNAQIRYSIPIKRLKCAGDAFL